eukprot:295000-Prymnesium_polylepis.1
MPRTHTGTRTDTKTRIQGHRRTGTQGTSIGTDTRHKHRGRRRRAPAGVDHGARHGRGRAEAHRVRESVGVDGVQLEPPARLHVPNEEELVEEHGACQSR